MKTQKTKKIVKTIKPVVKVPKVKKIEPRPDLPVINLTPITNWMVTSAYIEPQSQTLFAGANNAPKFLDMQQVFAVGPAVTHVAVGDWIYIDMTRFIKTVKKKSTIRAGVGGEDMVSEQMVPPVFAAPGDDTVYLKISDREIEGTINDPYSMGTEYITLEEYADMQESMEAEARKGKAEYDSIKPSTENYDKKKGPMIVTSTTNTRM